MKIPKKSIILTFLLTCVIILLGFSQNDQSDKEKRKAAVNSLVEKSNPGVKIRWNKNFNTIKAVRRLDVTKYSGTYEQMAKQFIDDEKAIWGIKKVDDNLKFRRITSTRLAM